jgi:anti-anti-sigma factor
MNQNAVASDLDLKFDIPKAPGETIVLCAGRITADTSPLLQSTVRLLILESKRIVLDLKHVDNVDSSGVGALVSLWVSMKRADCEFRLMNMNQRVKHLLIHSFNYSGLPISLRVSTPIVRYQIDCRPSPLSDVAAANDACGA